MNLGYKISRIFKTCSVELYGEKVDVVKLSAQYVWEIIVATNLAHFKKSLLAHSWTNSAKTQGECNSQG